MSDGAVAVTALTETGRQRPAPSRAGAKRRHLTLVPEPDPTVHDHLWSLRDTEFDDSGLTLSRFECDCGAVTYT